jgi:DNA-binding LytR/AlgR family response regulator
MKRILVIEDNRELCENICSLLEKSKYLYSFASSGEGALQLLNQLKPDLILCDIMLPDMNGYSVLKKIKKMENVALPIFIFLTAKTQREDIRYGMELGAEDYITKPFTKDELLNSIKIQFEKREKLSMQLKDNEIGPVKKGFAEKKSKNKFSTLTNTNSNYEEYLFLRSKKESGLFMIDEIVAIKSLKDYSQIYVNGNKTFVLRKTMNEWEKKLSNKNFLRIHRQTIINLKYVDKIEPRSSNRFQVSILAINKKFDVSQRYSLRLKQLFK